VGQCNDWLAMVFQHKASHEEGYCIHRHMRQPQLDIKLGVTLWQDGFDKAQAWLMRFSAVLL